MNGIAYELYISGNGTVHYISISPYHQLSISDLAVNCDGATYYSIWGRHLEGYYNDQRYFIINDYGVIDDIKLNEYGEIFVLFPNLIHIVMAYELPEGWYLCQLCKYPQEGYFSTRSKGPNCEPGEGEIVLHLDRDQGSNSDPLITLDKNNNNANILFGERPKITAYWRDKNGEESPISVKWEITGKSVSGNVSNKSLFKNTPVLLFTGGQNPYTSQYLDFQTVHIGIMTLKISSEVEGKEGTIEATININNPSRLGNAPNNFDSKIIEYADKYGIPPQYLKAHVNKEAKIKNNAYVANSFRYEPIGWDYGLSLYNKKGIYLWKKNDWARRGTSYDCFNYPYGTNLSNDIIQKIEDFYKIVEINPENVNPYICEKYANLSDVATLTEIYNANNGWGQGSFPNTYYRLMGPCNNIREGWDRHTFGHCNYVAYDFGKYYCGISQSYEEGCGDIQKGFINFLYNNSNYKAQVPIASSYGLMQIMYINATDIYGWKKGEDPCTKEPSLLFDVDENLNLGAKYDSKNMSELKIENCGNFSQYEKILVDAFQKYNERSKNYGFDVVNNAKKFKPKSQ